MNYWHINMSKPWGRDGGTIDSSQMLKEGLPLIGTGEWDDIQCLLFKDTDKYNRGLKNGDIILVREGQVPIALCKVIGANFIDIKLTQLYHHHNFRHVEVLEWYSGNDPFPQPQGTLQRLLNNNPSKSFVKNWYRNYLINSKMSNTLELLKNKKQIILQGPPGTGKTYTAEKIAKELCGISAPQLTPSDIKKHITVNLSIASSSGSTKYVVVNVSDTHVRVKLESNSEYDISYVNIIGKFNTILLGQKPENKNSLDPYEIAIAEYLLKNHKDDFLNENTDGEYQLIQFHPSYTYEDFVRGITAKNSNGYIEYITENKVLAEFAEKANSNFIASNKDVEALTKEQYIKSLIIKFSEAIQDEIDEKGRVKISDAVSIINVEKDAFRYTGEWQTSQRMKFSDLIIAEMNFVDSRQSLKNTIGISGLAIQHATYFFKTLTLFRDKFKAELAKKVNTLEKPTLKNYVLIIDEINRANLPSVLGELIYALEYRGKSVSSMYAIDGDNSLILPPNLYIIGTMNTADRSVGHIDYAIRRRFAFESILPDINVIKTQKGKDYFKEVEALFKDEYLSSDFKHNSHDVQIGHSYFMGEESLLSMKMKYEVVPILYEYLKDGIFCENAREAIAKFERTINV